MGHVRKVAAAKFKATCLKVMDRVAMTGEPIEVTKRGKPLVRLVPAAAAAERSRSIFGAAKHRILYLAPDEELFSPGEAWDAGR
jgi:prevent-host-death family protein